MDRIPLLFYVVFLSRFSQLQAVNSPAKHAPRCQDLTEGGGGGYTKNTATMMHIACAFCKKHKRPCQTAVCSTIRNFYYINFSDYHKDMKVLASALCDLCKYHKLGCKYPFCTVKPSNIKEQKFIASTCVICKENGTPCKKAKSKPYLIDWVNILDGPIWDRVLADDMFTTLLIGDVERGEWDGFLDNIMALSNDEYDDYYGEFYYDDYGDDYHEEDDSYEEVSSL